MSKFKFMKRGFNKKCPQCAGSPIFSKYITTYKKCKNCGLKLSDYKSDDGPAYITIFIVGHILIPMILLVEKYFRPPLINQMIIWSFLTVLISLWLLPRIKGAFIGIQIFLGDKSGKT